MAMSPTRPPILPSPIRYTGAVRILAHWPIRSCALSQLAAHAEFRFISPFRLVHFVNWLRTPNALLVHWPIFVYPLLPLS